MCQNKSYINPNFVQCWWKSKTHFLMVAFTHIQASWMRKIKVMIIYNHFLQCKKKKKIIMKGNNHKPSHMYTTGTIYTQYKQYVSTHWYTLAKGTVESKKSFWPSVSVEDGMRASFPEHRKKKTCVKVASASQALAQAQIILYFERAKLLYQLKILH